ncbi:radical SAM protein [Streptomyces sp. GSL17-111]|uniref:radical SAM protein n=1 Tax=Streptomyces sp. GSL17-111 TaxID=3121596 RepID=UPI0030F3AC4E
MSTRVRTALISTAGHCKVACGFCFRSDRAHGFLDTATYTRHLSRLKEAGVEGVRLSGGEPTHHPQLRQLVRLAHPFGMAVSMVTSARTVAEVIAPLPGGAPAGQCDRLRRLAGRHAAGPHHPHRGLRPRHTARAISTETKILHVTCWGLRDEECQDLAGLVSEVGVEVQFSPVVLDERALRRDGKSVQDYLVQQRLDADVLSRHFDLSDRYRAYLDELGDLQFPTDGGERWSCRSAAAYVSADGDIRRCPYGQASVSAHAPRAAIRQFLTAPAQDRVMPDWRPSAAPPVRACDDSASCAAA